MKYCAYCGTQLTEEGGSCPQCGQAAQSSAKIGVIEKIFAILPYWHLLGLILAFFLKRSSSFVRYHAKESLKIHITSVGTAILTFIVGALSQDETIATAFLVLQFLVSMILAAFLLICSVRVLQGKKLPVPVIGKLFPF